MDHYHFQYIIARVSDHQDWRGLLILPSLFLCYISSSTLGGGTRHLVTLSAYWPAMSDLHDQIVLTAIHMACRSHTKCRLYYSNRKFHICSCPASDMHAATKCHAKGNAMQQLQQFTHTKANLIEISRCSIRDVCAKYLQTKSK